MKNAVKLSFLLALFVSVFTSCSNEEDFEIPPYKAQIFGESFPEDQINYNAVFDFPGWVNFAEAGTFKWTERDFDGSGYIQFNPYGSGQASNIAWAITPKFNLDNTTGEVLTFKSATNFVDNPANKLEVYISNNFDGTNVLAATWTQLSAVVANETTNGYIYIPSGEIDLSSYSGDVNIAFRVVGNGTTLDGLFQVDDVKVYVK